MGVFTKKKGKPVQALKRVADKSLIKRTSRARVLQLLSVRYSYRFSTFFHGPFNFNDSSVTQDSKFRKTSSAASAKSAKDAHVKCR